MLWNLSFRNKCVSQLLKTHDHDQLWMQYCNQWMKYCITWCDIYPKLHRVRRNINSTYTDRIFSVTDTEVIDTIIIHLITYFLIVKWIRYLLLTKLTSATLQRFAFVALCRVVTHHLGNTDVCADADVIC